MQKKILPLALSLSLLAFASACKESPTPTTHSLPTHTFSPPSTPTQPLVETPHQFTPEPITRAPLAPEPITRALPIQTTPVLISEDQTGDPCLYEDPNTLPQPILPLVSSSNDSPYGFQIQLQSNPEVTLKQWLLTTQTFRGANLEDIRIQALPRGTSMLNAGIYEVSSPQTGDLRFILKVSIMNGEAEKLWRIQNSRVGHPECFQRTDLGLHHVASPEEIASFPRIPKLREATQFQIDPSQPINGAARQSRTHRFLILMEKAPGMSLGSIPSEQTHLLETAYRRAGKSLGSLQYFMAANPTSTFNRWRTWRHGDLHANNLFFDPETQIVTFIDHSDLTGNQDLRNLSYDFDQLTYRPLNTAIHYSGNSELHRFIADHDHRFGLNISWDGYITNSCLSTLNHHQLNPDNLAVIQSSPAFQNVETRFQHYADFVRGYLEAMPQSHHHEVSTYFKNEVRGMIREFINWRIRDEASHIVNLRELNPDLELEHRRLSPNLVRTMRSSLPTSLLEYIDQTH